VNPDPLVARFCDQLVSEGLIAEAVEMELALHAIDLEGDGNRDAAAMWEAIRWVLRQPGRSIGERLEALGRVLSNKGTIRLPADLGWK
jgi:hypothetical protein